MCSPRYSAVKWKIIYAGLCFILWLYTILLCLVDIRETWQGGYGRVNHMVGFSTLPPCVPAIPLLILPVLICRKQNIIHFMISCLTVLVISTFCLCLSTTIILETSLNGLETRLDGDLRNKYGHGISNNISNLVFTQSMDYAQYTFQCCGIKSDEDYFQSDWYKDERGKMKLVPPSCCIPETQTSIINISHSGTPINVVSRVFYGMLEEGWQNPQPKHEKNCQSSNSSQFKTARYTTGCLKSIKAWVRMENIKTIILDVILVALEIITIIYCVLMPHDVKHQHYRRKRRYRNNAANTSNESGN